MIPAFRRNGLLLGLALGLALLLLSYARIIGDSQSMAFREEVLETIFRTTLWGTTLMWNLVWFCVALVMLHLAFGLLCWAIGTLSAGLSAAPSSAKKERQHILLWFLLLALGLLALNGAVYSRSSLGSAYARILTAPIASIELGKWIAALIFCGALAVGGIAAYRRIRSGWRPLENPRGLAIACLVLLLPFAVTAWSSRNPTHNDGSRTNVILIGIDSLRQDIMLAPEATTVAPHMSAFLADAAWFTDTMTPLARTFPSVMSIETGRQPHKTGAYMNLPPRELIQEGDTLGRIFGRAGYHSVFAMDEVRFANIDNSYGFDQTISPAAGATEFLLSMLADTPLSNSIVNTRLGSLLFPFIYANRGAAATYDPDTFIDRVSREVRFDKPLFLHTHFTLSHWPYTWADAPLPGPKKEQDTWPDYYLDVIHRVDLQFADLMEELRARGVLGNAIVVLYSDHGESFGQKREALVPDDDPLIRALAAEPQWGHGSTVLTAHQFKVVLGIRGFGDAAGKFPAGHRFTAAVSVMDIAPTVTELTGVPPSTAFDGLSLVPLLKRDTAAASQFAHRVRFTETEFTPVDVATPDGKMSASGIVRAAEMYDIDPVTDRVEVKRANVGSLLRMRQYAAVGDEFLLAALPLKQGGLSHAFVLIHKNGSTPVLLATPPTPDATEDLHRVWNAMQENFKGIVPTGPELEAVSRKSLSRHVVAQ